jgi:hypothetical protein
MRYRWIRKEANLDHVFSDIERFFNSQEFCRISKVDKVRRELTVQVCPRGERSVAIYVRVYNRPDGFEVSFSAEKAILFGKMGFLSTMFGTGVFIKDKLRVVSIIDKLEERFWLYMNDVVSAL